MTQQNRKSTWRNIFLILGILIAGLFIYIGYLYDKTEKTVESTFESIGRENNQSLLRKEIVNPIDDHVSLLLIGIDHSGSRQNHEASRSDTLLFATFNKDENTVKLLTIPRDTYVYLPEINGYTKINHAHAYGGPKTTVQTVEQFLNVPVDYYVRVDFEAVVKIVDILGGIEFEVPFEIYESDSQNVRDAIHLQPGRQHLNGEETLALARNRKYDSDIARGKRQQEIIQAIFERAKSSQTLLKINELIETIGQYVTTNISFEHMKGFIAYGLHQDLTIEFENFKGEGKIMEDGLWYYHINDDSRKDIEETLRIHLDL